MKKKTCFLFLFMLAIGCKKPYNPPAITSTSNYLVVEGVISAGADSTIIKLSRTVGLSKSIASNPVLNASLTIESDANSSYPLTELTKGYYASPGLNLDNSLKYRLRIKTPDNKVYLSDFVPVSVTPPIDSISFTALNNGLELYANTHDPQNNTRYYRWDYTETWQFHSLYSSSNVTDGTQIVNRPADQQIYYCFAGDVSSNIILGSSAKLAQDVIYQNPIGFIPSTSEKIELKYSILLKQYALTKDAFTFWTNLKKNTEQLGSIFDAQPSQINGNIHNINNADEPVIGYISACSIQSKRIFISNTQLPNTWRTTYPYDCQMDSLFYMQAFTLVNQVQEYLVPIGSGYVPLYQFPNPPMPALGYISAYRECVDCTIRGTKQTPAFWQ